ncbi:hypothetical protein C3Y87_18880 [Carbonactinospora thermoautotrophica]|uniref:hypothetical protein n=1 Tax=Carbonactinospora thermoautotrophica TaxID=1469144 RepID=UPI00226FBD02|nr:hypothetical protein [Carbonactinospora thermoautotrophica]MCX9193425.1 hypothetical protein [Carbonactinospora thermoautotrophica]
MDTEARGQAVAGPLSAGPQPVEVRRRLEELVVRDLLGPIGGETEQMPSRERPTEYYILGRLAPRGTLIDPGGQDALAEEEPADNAQLYGAACHACLFAAETSCERGNHYLDRALVVDTLATSGIGFFAG